jgi:hypothetical protein
VEAAQPCLRKPERCGFSVAALLFCLKVTHAPGLHVRNQAGFCSPKPLSYAWRVLVSFSQCA